MPGSCELGLWLQADVKVHPADGGELRATRANGWEP